MADNVQTFQWTGINKQGERLKGNIQAIDIKAAQIELKGREIEIINIKPKVRSTFTLTKRKIKNKDIILFTRYLATMLIAGLPILQALDVIATDQENEALKSVIISLRTNIASGKTFSESLTAYPNYFNELYCNLVRAGEKSGTLDKVLLRLSKYMQRIQSLKSKIKTALIYPITIIVIATVVSLILLLFVIPQFQHLFESAHVQLPYFTRLIISVSNGLRSYWWLLLLAAIGFVMAFRYLLKTNEGFKKEVDRMLLKIPIVGPIIQKAIIARFSSTLAITLDAGLPIVESMEAMVNIMGNSLYSKAVQQICGDLTSGHQLSIAMSNTKLFPPMVVQMISVGEASGELPTMLNNVADAYQEDVDMIANSLSTLIEPLIIAVLGLIIGGFVIAMYLPIFKLGSTL